VRRTWVEKQFAGDGDDGWHEVVRHIVDVYRRHLECYVKHRRSRDSRLRLLGEPGEVVEDFFSSRLSRREYLEQWIGHPSRKRLRFWLINGLHLYFKERLREHRKEQARRLSDDEAALLGAEEEFAVPEVLVDQTFAAALVSEAFRETRRRLGQGRSREWLALEGHYLRGRTYDELAIEIGTTENVVRTKLAPKAREVLHGVLRELLAKDGASTDEDDKDEIDAEIRYLLEITRLPAADGAAGFESFEPELLSRVLLLGRRPRPVDELVSRLEESGEADGVLAHLAARLSMPAAQLEEKIAGGKASLDELIALKERCKRLHKEGGDDNRLAGLAGYHLAVGAALRHHRSYISSQPRVEFDLLLLRLADCLPEPWRKVLREAAAVR
jgi:DNA-directed RNA polymerase specialized sigma24 family protein